MINSFGAKDAEKHLPLKIYTNHVGKLLSCGKWGVERLTGSMYGGVFPLPIRGIGWNEETQVWDLPK